MQVIIKNEKGRTFKIKSINHFNLKIMKMKIRLNAMLAVSLSFLLNSCIGDDDHGGTPPLPPTTAITLKNHSITPNYLKLKPEFSDVNIYAILSSEDTLEGAPSFVYGSMADGLGLLKNQDGTFSMINNIEADYSIARITFDHTFKPIFGEYILNAEATAYTAQCSGSLITPLEHGFGPLYLSGGEWGGNSKGVFVTDPYRNANDAGIAQMLPAMGQWSTENAVAIGKNAFPDKTIVFIGDDDSNDEIPSGQLGMYMGERGDLDHGDLYGLRVTDPSIIYEMDMIEGKTYEAEFVAYQERTLAELDAEAKAKGIMGFSRLEDIDWRRGSAKNNRELYLTVTGRKKDGLVGKGTIYGRIYKVVLNKKNPLKATISCILDGDKLDGKAKEFLSPDNILVTQNYAYIQEDPNGYRDTPDKDHFARLYQYNLNTGELKTVLECDQVTAAMDGIGTESRSWEITGMIDISTTIGVPETFAIITQNHGWEKEEGTGFTDPKANPSADARKEGSQMMIIQGLER